MTYGTISKTYTIGARCWLDRNLGATQVATSSTDPLAYGDLFQWGRLDDGHQDRGSTTTSTLSATDVPGHSDFIKTSISPNDWRDEHNNDLWQGVDGINNPCPAGWRVPTEAELEAELNNWGSNNSTGAFASQLKWPVGGLRLVSSSLNGVDSDGVVWSSSVSGTNARALWLGSSSAGMRTHMRARGMSVRCVWEP